MVGLRLDHSKIVQIVRCLIDGVGVRATARIVDCHRDTVLAVLETVGGQCATFLDKRLRNLTVITAQIDELWSRVYCRQLKTMPEDTEHGDFYTFLGIDARTKLIVSHYTGKRTYESTRCFVRDFASRIDGRPQVTTDGWFCYPPLLSKYLYTRMDYATMQKIYASDLSKNQDSIRRYSPPACKGIWIKVESGRPNPKNICTSHVERLNLSVRTHNRRFTRLGLGYSKKLLNHRLAVALFVTAHNFVKKHATLGTTPAAAHKLTDHVWSVEELIEEVSRA